MSDWHPTRDKILSAFKDDKPKAHREVAKATGLSLPAIWRALHDYWKEGFLLRTEKPTFEAIRVFRGRAGFTRNTRSYYLYVLKPDGVNSIEIQGKRFVGYAKKHLDIRGARETSKSRLVLNFLRGNSDRAFYSTEIAETLKDKGVSVGDVIGAARRAERKGLVYVRGYRTHDRQTPFRQGYLLTWIDLDKPREEAIKEAVERTSTALFENSTSPIIERIHSIRDQIIGLTQLKDLASFNSLQEKLGCTEHEASLAVERALQLYPDLKEVKLFNAYKYYYHTSISQEDLKATVALKENYIRVAKGRENRIGHNWEACVEWFIDKFTVGAEFQTQNHRGKRIDPRRITLYLLKPVGDRRNTAEVDRVWSVTPGIFSQPITYVLESKWGLVRKHDVDDFFNVLRWSKEFGVDTENGREIKQGVIGVFAGGAFNPEEKVHLKDESIGLPSYASRMNVQLLKSSDFNVKLHEHGCSQKVSLQKICERAKDEPEVKETLDTIWKSPKKAEEILIELAERNQELYKFEKMLKEDD